MSEPFPTPAARLLALGHSHWFAGRYAPAVAAFRELVALEPLHADGWHGLAVALQSQGLADDAGQAFARAIAIAPDAFEFRSQYAALLQARGALEPAAEQWRAASELRPDDAWCAESLGICEQALGDVAAARAAYERALALAPGAARRLKLATLVSPIIASREAMHAERAAMARAMDMLAESDERLDDPLEAGLWTNFYLAFHGEDDRALQEKSAAAYLRACPSLGYVAPHCGRARRPGRLRVGLISQFFHNHSIGRTSRGLFAQLDRARFEVTALFVPPAVDDAYARFVRAHAERSVLVPDSLAEARRAIAALELDVLFYQDIGMEPFTYFLAFSQLAPVQCVSFGHPDTTGIPAMDWWISNDRYEPADAASHYSESLFLLRDLPTLAYYYRPPRDARAKTRADFGLADAARVYLCPQNLFKLHPDMDDLLAAILRRDEGARAAVVAGRVGAWDALVRARWQRTMPDVAHRIVAVPRQDSAGFVDLIACADVMLDTVHFNGMNTSLEALSVGTPVVTWPGRFQRGRHTQAMYGAMELGELVAADAAGYVDVAVRVANERDYREYCRREILERNAVLFENARVVRELERCFDTIAAR